MSVTLTRAPVAAPPRIAPRTSGAGGAVRAAVSYWLSGAALALALLAAATGLLVPGFYRDPPYWAAGARGTDLVTLMLALPTLAVAVFLSSRGSLRARLVWLGALVYLTYAYVFFAFGVAFNPLFPVYIGVFTLAGWSILTMLLGVDARQVQARTNPGQHARSSAAYLLLLAALFLVVWMREIVTAILAGSPPPGVREAGLPVNPTHVLDLGFLLPLCAVGGVLLWRRRPWGYVLGGLLLPATMLVAAFSAAAVGFGFAAIGELGAVLVPVALFALLALIGLALTAAYLRHLQALPGGEAEP